MENAFYRGMAVEKKRRNNDNIATMNQVSDTKNSPTSRQSSLPLNNYQFNFFFSPLPPLRKQSNTPLRKKKKATRSASKIKSKT